RSARAADGRAVSGREVLLVRRIAGGSTIAARAPVGAGAIELSVLAGARDYRFAIRAAGKTTILGTLPARGLSAEEVSAHGGNYFTGVYVGAFATGNGRRSTAPADFDWFECAPPGTPVTRR
ncbi:MAG: hypothetical protein ABUS56_08555, partial [Acidobacteriota bacterium]